MLRLFIDGSAAPNPGFGGAGFVVYDGEEQIMHGHIFLGLNVTNNQAEFLALVHSLFHVVNKFFPEELQINTDSELVYSAYMGTKQVRSPKLINIFKAGEQVVSCVPKVHWNKISRLTNGYADNLARRAIDKKNSEVYILGSRAQEIEKKDS